METNRELLLKMGVKKFSQIDERELKRRQILDQLQKKLEDPEILDTQIMHLKGFRNDYLSRGDMKAQSIYSAVCVIIDLAKYIKKPFLEMDKNDINAFCHWCRYERIVTTGKKGKLGNKGVNERSMISKHVHIKYFFRWLFDEEGIEYKDMHPDHVKHLSTIIKDRGVIHKQDIPTYEEIRRMVYRADNARDKALMMMLFDTGARVSEILGLKIRDVTILKDYGEIRIRQSKTMPRTNIITISLPFLNHYLRDHPFKDEVDSPLFINLNQSQYGRQLMYQGALDAIKRCAKRAGIEKRMSCHLFRHARATDRANHGWNESVMRKQFGWTSASNTPSVYIHIAEDDVKNKILQEQGIIYEDTQEKAFMDTIECPRCFVRNAWDAVTCECGLVLNPLGTERGMQIFEEEMKAKNIDPAILSEQDKSDLSKRMFEKFSSNELDNWILNQLDPNLEKKRPTYKYKQKAKRLRKEGYSFQDIAHELGIGYGSARTLCLEE